MLWVFRMLGMLRLVAFLGMLPATGMVRILGWPLLAALGQAGWASMRMLLDLHARILSARASRSWAAASSPPLIRVAI